LVPADALLIRDFIHAQRRRFRLTETCSTTWRPFQPGGEVLPGANADQQDDAFLQSMKQRGVTVFTGKVVTLPDAQRALAELQGIDLRELPIGIPLPRWTEDPFNGPEHTTNNDYMPPVPTMPNDPVSFYQKEDAYLSDPTDERLLELLRLQEEETNDGGYAAPINAGPPDNICEKSDKKTHIVDYLRSFKRSSVLVAQHLFRLSLLQKKTDLTPQLPVPGKAFLPNPMLGLGGTNAEPSICGGGFSHETSLPTIMAIIPNDMKAQLSANDREGNVFLDLSKELAHPWMVLGELYDQALVTESPVTGRLQYWAGLIFPHKTFHLPFMYAHRAALRVTYWERYQQKTDPHPLLDGKNFHQEKLESVAPYDGAQYEGSERTAADANRLRGNLIRMFLLLEIDLLRQGRLSFSEPGTESMAYHIGRYYGFAKTLAQTIPNDSVQAPLREDIALYTTGIVELTDEALRLLHPD